MPNPWARAKPVPPKPPATKIIILTPAQRRDLVRGLTTAIDMTEDHPPVCAMGTGRTDCDCCEDVRDPGQVARWVALINEVQS